MILLAALAGAINAIAVFGYDGTTVSHVTGLISKFAIAVGVGDFWGCLDFLWVILAFFLGAVVAGIATGEKAFHLYRVYGCIILGIGALILLPLVLPAEYAVWLFAFLMGLQNGMAVSFKGVLVRLTHMSGNLTDFGVYVGYALRGNRHERLATGAVPAALLFGFTAGGIGGILFERWLGKYVFVAISAAYVLLGLVYFHFVKTLAGTDKNGNPDEAAGHIWAELK